MKTRRQEEQEEDAAEILAHRRELVTELQRLQAEQLAALVPLLKAEEQAKAKLDKAADALQAAHDAYMGAMSAHMGCSNHYGHKLAKLERDLLASAPPEISAFVAEMRALAERIGKAPLADAAGRELQPIDYRRCSIAERTQQEQALRDADSRRQNRLGCIRQAIAAADALKLRALDAATLTDRLDVLRRSTEEVHNESV